MHVPRVLRGGIPAESDRRIRHALNALTDMHTAKIAPVHVGIMRSIVSCVIKA